MAQFLSIERLTTPVAASAAFVAIGPSNSICSGSYISDSGHIATAGHCLDQCMFGEQNSIQNTTGKCELNINGTMTSVRILSMASCTQRQIRQANAQMEGFDPSCANQSDVAIVIAENRPENFACLAMAQGEVDSEDLFTMGIPNRTRRGDGFDSDGSTLQFSTGRIFPKSETSCIVGANGILTDRIFGRHQPGNRLSLPELSVRILGQHDVRTTIDGVNGNSGGPLMNEHAEILGVGSARLFNQQRDLSKVSCLGTMLFSRFPDESTLARGYRAPGFSMSEVKCEHKKVTPIGIRELFRQMPI